MCKYITISSHSYILLQVYFLIFNQTLYGLNTLRPTHMAAISQTFSSAFSWMKMFELRLKFHWSLFLRVQLTIFQHRFRWWLGAVQATSHYLNQWWPSSTTQICVTRPQRFKQYDKKITTKFINFTPDWFSLMLSDNGKLFPGNKGVASNIKIWFS